MSWKGAGSLQPPNRGARESRAISDGSEPNELKRDLILSKTAEFHRSVTHAWFDQMHAPMARRRIVFTAVGLITADPASVESVLTWADRLQGRVAYLIVENETDANATFTYRRDSAQARAFQRAFDPAVIQMAYRLPHLETAMRNHGVTLSAVVQRQTTVPELGLSKAVLRAEGYRQRLFEQFDTVKDLLLP